MKSGVLILAVAAFTLLDLPVASSLQCNGRPSLVDTYSAMCKTQSSSASLYRKASCMTPKIAEANVPVCTATDRCTEINIKASSGQFSNTDSLVWSVSACWKQEMAVLVCSDGFTVATTVASSDTTTAATTAAATTTAAAAAADTTTTTAAATESTVTDSTTTGPTTSTTAAAPTETTTAAETTAVTGSTESTTTAEGMTTTTAAAAAPTTTTAPVTTTTEAPTTAAATTPFTGCLSATVTFNTATCEPKNRTRLSAMHYNSTDQSETGTPAYIDLTVVGCCNNADRCRVDDSIERPNTCYFGDQSGISQITCASACFGYLKEEAGVTTAKMGCLEDLDLTGTSFSSTTDCSGQAASGTCVDANGNTECIKCCTGSACNDYRSKDQLLGIVDQGGGNNVASVLSATCLLIVSALLTALH